MSTVQRSSFVVTSGWPAVVPYKVDGNTVCLAPMNAEVGGEVKDATSNGIDGTLTGGATVATGEGRWGGAVTLDGSDDYVDFGNNFGSLAAGTVEFWFSPESDIDDSLAVYKGLCTKYNDNTNRFELTFTPQAGKAGQLRLLLLETNSALYSGDAYNYWEAGVWHHVAATFGTRGLELWIDGKLVASDTSITDGLDDVGGTGSFVMGCSRYNDGGGAAYADFFDGKVEELRVSDVQRDTFYSGGIVRELSFDTFGRKTEDVWDQGGTPYLVNTYGPGTILLADAQDHVLLADGSLYRTDLGMVFGAGVAGQAGRGVLAANIGMVGPVGGMVPGGVLFQGIEGAAGPAAAGGTGDDAPGEPAPPLGPAVAGDPCATLHRLGRLIPVRLSPEAVEAWRRTSYPGGRAFPELARPTELIREWNDLERVLANTLNTDVDCRCDCSAVRSLIDKLNRLRERMEEAHRRAIIQNWGEQDFEWVTDRMLFELNWYLERCCRPQPAEPSPPAMGRCDREESTKPRLRVPPAFIKDCCDDWEIQIDYDIFSVLGFARATYSGRLRPRCWNTTYKFHGTAYGFAPTIDPKWLKRLIGGGDVHPKPRPERVPGASGGRSDGTWVRSSFNIPFGCCLEEQDLAEAAFAIESLSAFDTAVLWTPVCSIYFPLGFSPSSILTVVGWLGGNFDWDTE